MLQNLTMLNPSVTSEILLYMGFETEQNLKYTE